MPDAQKGQVGWYIVRVDYPGRCLARRPRPSTRICQFSLRDQDRNRIRLRRQLGEAIRKHQVPDYDASARSFSSRFCWSRETPWPSPCASGPRSWACSRPSAFPDRVDSFFRAGGVAGDRGRWRLAGPASCRVGDPRAWQRSERLLLPLGFGAVGVRGVRDRSGGRFAQRNSSRIWRDAPAGGECSAEGLKSIDGGQTYFRTALTLGATFALLILAGLLAGLLAPLSRIGADFLQLPQHQGALDFDHRGRAGHCRNGGRVRGHAFAGARFQGHAGGLRLSRGMRSSCAPALPRK